MSYELAPEYVAARTTLLDAFDILAVHRSALIVVGAQAVYLRTDDAGMTTTPSTKDGDVVINPNMLSPEPELFTLMEANGFSLKPMRNGGFHQGQWVRTAPGTDDIVAQIDLIVPSDVLPNRNRRGARLTGHNKSAAMRSHGLEAALVDYGPLQISGFAEDRRSVTVNVAGPTALLVAKVHKINDRVNKEDVRPDRLVDKDALDVLRLLRTTTPGILRSELDRLSDNPISANATREAMDALPTLFGTPRSPGVKMAVRATHLDFPADTVEVQLTGFVHAILGRA